MVKEARYDRMGENRVVGEKRQSKEVEKMNVGLLTDHFVMTAATMRPETELLEKIAEDRKVRGIEEECDVMQFELQKFCQRAEGRPFYPVWAKPPVMTLEVAAYNIWLEAPESAEERRIEISKAFSYWENFTRGLETIEADFLDPMRRKDLSAAGQTKLADGRMLKMRCSITGEVCAFDRRSAELNAGFRYRDGDLSVTAGSTIWMNYDLARNHGVITETRTRLPVGKILAIEAENFQPEKNWVSRSWLENLLAQDSSAVRRVPRRSKYD